MNEKVREEFEAWRSSKGWTRPDDPGEWEAWQASRATLEIELPAAEAWLNDGRLDREPDGDAGERMGLIPRVDVRAALRNAGVRVK